MKTITAEQLPAELDAMSRVFHGDPLAKALGESAQVLRESFAENFAEATSGSGAKWHPRKNPNAPGRSGNPGHPLLIDLGELRLSVVQKGAPGNVERINNRELAVGTSQHVSSGSGKGAPYHVFHEFGTSRMPARPYLDPRQQALDQCEQIIGDALLEAVLAV